MDSRDRRRSKERKRGRNIEAQEQDANIQERKEMGRGSECVW